MPPDDELDRYVIQELGGWMTPAERAVRQYYAFMSAPRTGDSDVARRRFAEFALNQGGPETARFIEMGEAAFRVAVRERILQEYGDAVLNRCPRCGALPRTVRARQCPKCFYRWSDRKENSE